MYLYNKNNDKIEVYSMIPNKERIYKFKKEQMQIIPEKERILKEVTNSDLLICDYTHFSSIPAQVFRKSTLLDRTFHTIEPYKLTSDEKKLQGLLLENYYKGNINPKPVKITKYVEEIEEWEIIKYLLVTRSSALNDKKRNIKILNNIICLPESLYLLEILLMNRFELIKDQNLSKQVGLFDVSNKPVDTIDINEILKADKYEVADFSKSQVASNINKSQKILKHVK